MFRTRRIPLFALFALTWTLMAVALLSGCVTQSIHPLYDERTMVFEESLLGSWGDDEAVWSFSADGAGGYDLLHTDDEATIEASAHLVRLDDHLFLDVIIDELPEGSGELHEALLLPLHTVFRVGEIGDRLITSSLRWNWLEERLRDNPGEIAHTFVDDRALLTDDTEALQRFFRDHAADLGAWELAVVMERR